MVSGEKVDYKKRDRELYRQSTSPTVVDVPEMNFITVDERGSPDSEVMATAMATIYSLTYAIKMKGKELPGYFEYVILPPEGLWWNFDKPTPDEWRWTVMMRQPEFVTQKVFEWAKDLVGNKPGTDTSKAEFRTVEEGRCMQMLHVGPYSDIHPGAISKLVDCIESKGYAVDMNGGRKYHEIYFSDPHKVEESKLKTLIRLPIK